jgi:histidyl-tRNA synthetase
MTVSPRRRFIANSPDAPNLPGAYALLIRLDAPLLAKAGRHAATLTPGRYVYCGSAKGGGGIAARLGRHMRREKRTHWHVDQLTCAGTTLGAWAVPGGDECALNEELAVLPIPLEGFGSTDCPRCKSHMRFWPADAALPSHWENARKNANSITSAGEPV